jgi:3-deoxy-7-phosphoheptulonate synthase
MSHDGPFLLHTNDLAAYERLSSIPIPAFLVDFYYCIVSGIITKMAPHMNPKWNGQFSCFDLVARTNHRTRSVVRVRDIEIGGDEVVVMAGPCAVESERQVLETAEAVAEAGARVLRGGAYKPRSSPYAFQGLGIAGLKILSKARSVTGLAIVTEVMSERDVDVIAEYADIMQVGTRSMENYALLEALGKCGRPVLLKRGMVATLEDLLRSAQVIALAGNPNIILCERGIRTFETATRNTLDIAAVPVLKAVSHLPVIVDPSHAAGVRCLVPVLSQASIAVGADGLIVEVHPAPECAMSDGNQSLNFQEFRGMMNDIQPYLALQQEVRRLRPQLAVAG